MNVRRPLLKAMTSCLCLASINSAFASGFQLFEVNAQSLSDFGASAISKPTDASINFFNPGATSAIPNKQLVVAATYVNVDLQFIGNVTNSVGTGANREDGFVVAGEGSVAATKTTNAIPALHYAQPLTRDVSVGVSLTVPFGLETSWRKTSILRYAATKSAVETINLGPSISWRASPNFSIGVGLDIQYASAVFNSMVRSTPAGPGLADSESKSSANGFGLGGNIGAYFKSQMVSIGVGFRSQVVHRLRGESVFSGPLAGGVDEKSRVKGSVTLPATIFMGATLYCNDKLDLSFSAIHTRWGVIRSLVLDNVSSPVGRLNIGVPQGFKNTWRFALGGFFQATEQFGLRAGVGLDNSPSNDNDRSVRLPDERRYAVSLGLRFTPNAFKSMVFDVGYTHLFIREADIDYTADTGSQTAVIKGYAASSADLLSAQLTWNIK